MLALAAHPLGVRVQSLCSGPEDPAGRVARSLVESGNREEDLRLLAEAADVLTYESENAEVHELREACPATPIEPPLRALELSQDRLLEKRLLRDLGIPLADFQPVESLAELELAIARVGMPAVLKTRRGGYDGKGQACIRGEFELAAAWQRLQGRRLVLEEFVRFERELSIVAVRSREGEIRFYSLVENIHAGGILRATIAPAERVAPRIERQAREHTTRILESLDYVGVLAVEFFEREGGLLVNEIAPRVHNSGHWTIEGAQTSQFENHVRAVCGLPLGSTEARGCSAMLNLLGSLPELDALLSIPGAHVHLYDKPAAPGRKLGHVTLCATDRRELAGRLASALETLGNERGGWASRMGLLESTNSNSSL
jgi:5-(carboxyamino)imidazole ribonucleotide synthase